jgi:hypothetical protein
MNKRIRYRWKLLIAGNLGVLHSKLFVRKPGDEEVERIIRDQTQEILPGAFVAELTHIGAPKPTHVWDITIEA